MFWHNDYIAMTSHPPLQCSSTTTILQCLQQENGVDCSLSAFAVSVHILAGLPLQNDTFTQQHITQFQQLLPSLLKKQLLHMTELLLDTILHIAS